MLAAASRRESQADQAEINDLLAQIQASEEKEQSRIAEMIQDFKKLNDDGKAKAIERVHELTEIPRYQDVYAIAFEQYKEKNKK